MDPRTLSLSERVKISAPCPMKWSEMRGDNRIRHCDACKLNVYNSLALTSDELEALINEGQRTCMLVYRRGDGTLVTGDCSRLWAERKAAASSLLTEGLSVLGVVVVLLVLAGLTVVALFGDNIRRMYGSSSGGISGSSLTPPSPAAKKKGLKDFGNENTY